MSFAFYPLSYLIVGPLSVYVCTLNRTFLLVTCVTSLVRKNLCFLPNHMPSTPIKSCNKYVLSYKDSSNNTHEVGFYARDAYDCLMLAREFNSYVHDNPGSVIRIQQKF